VITAGTQPQRIVVAGDWHGNTRWAETALYDSHKLLAGEDLKVVLQLGDFGVFSDAGGDYFLQQVHSALELFDMWLMVTPGNHEDYDRIESWRDDGYPPLATFSPLVSGERLNRIIILPRGHRWTWHGRTWLSCGGAASPDRAWRIEQAKHTGVDMWWPQEYISDDDVRRCVDGGHADVLVSHDRPSLARIYLPPWPPMWADADHARCEISREKVQAICRHTQPYMVMHGHYHQPFSDVIADLGYGYPVRVAQLGMDGTGENYRVLDAERLEWLTLEEPVPER
jgi:Calcineurin-like phosphoesterase